MNYVELIFSVTNKSTNASRSIWGSFMENTYHFRLESPEERLTEKLVYCQYPSKTYKKAFTRIMLFLNVVLIMSTIFAFMYFLEEISSRGWLIAAVIIVGAGLIFTSIRYFGPRSVSRYGSWDFGITSLSIGNMLIVLGLLALFAATIG